MIRTTQKNLRELAGMYTDITTATDANRAVIMKKEGWLDQIMYAAGTYGCNGKVFRGNNTGELYIITRRSAAIYIFS